MFEFVRRNTRLFQFILLILILPSFALVGMQGYTSLMNSANAVVATVDGKKVLAFGHPFLGIATAVTRRAQALDAPLHPEEALTREQALRCYTINNARLLHCDDRCGSLEPGKRADFAVLDTDLLACAAERIAQIRVLRTYTGGRLVFDRGL